MTVQEYYTKVNGNYGEAMSRFMNEERILKYLRKLPNSTAFADLCKAMQNEEWENAFAAVHSMKGVTANMALTEIFDLTVALTEELRGGSCKEQGKVYFQSLKEKYENAITLIDEL